MTEGQEVPEHRCGFELTPEDQRIDWNVDLPDWRQKIKAISCCREPWRDSERCIWHAEVEHKPISQLKSAHSSEHKRIDGVYLVEVDAGDTLNFEGFELIFPNLSESDFSGACFDHARLLGAQFQNTSFVGASFAETAPVNLQFSDIDFYVVQFTGSDLRRAEFVNAWLPSSNFAEVRGSRADFSDSTLKRGTFTDSDLRRAKFSFSDLRDARFSGADLSKVEFNPATLRNAQLSNTNLVGADFSNSSVDGADFSDARIDDAEFSEASLVNTGFQNADLSGAKFINAEPRGAQFSNASLGGADFTDAKLTGTKFPNADATGANFSGALLPKAGFPNADLEKAIFNDANLRDANLRDANLRGAKLPASELPRGDLGNVDARDAYFGATNLQEADLAQADLRGAILIAVQCDQTVLADTRIDATTDFGDSPDKWGPTSVYESHPEATEPPGDRSHWEAAEWVYRRLQKLHEENALSDEARGFHVRKEEVRRQQQRQKLTEARERLSEDLADNNTDEIFESFIEVLRWDTRYSVSKLQWHLTRHGESLGQIFVSAGVLILACGLLYPFVGGFESSANDMAYRIPLTEAYQVFSLDGVATLLQSIYFSIITFTTIGYGDLYPTGTGSKVLVGFESLAGAILIALFVFVLGRQVAR